MRARAALVSLALGACAPLPYGAVVLPGNITVEDVLTTLRAQGYAVEREEDGSYQAKRPERMGSYATVPMLVREGAHVQASNNTPQVTLWVRCMVLGTPQGSVAPEIGRDPQWNDCTGRADRTARTNAKRVHAALADAHAASH